MSRHEAIFRAAREGNVELARTLLEEEPPLVTARDPESEETPLHVAASFGHEAVVSLLLRYGADVNAEAFYHYTPLTSALRTGNTSVAEMLRKHGGEEYD